MNLLQARIVIPGILFLLIFLSGYWLSSTGKPFGTLLLTFHKLVALGVLAFVVITAYRVHHDTGLNASALVASVVTVILFVTTIITGGWSAHREQCRASSTWRTDSCRFSSCSPPG